MVWVRLQELLMGVQSLALSHLTVVIDYRPQLLVLGSCSLGADINPSTPLPKYDHGNRCDRNLYFRRQC